MGLTTDSMSAADLAAIVGSDRGGGFFGGDGLYGIIVLFLIMGMMGNGFGGFGGFGGGGAFPWMAAGQVNTNNDVQRGFDQSALMGELNAIQGAVAGGFSSAEIAACGRAMNQMQTDYNNQISSLTQMNTLNSSLQQCCCENRANIADLKYTVATEACADRQAISDGIRDLLAATQAQTQTIIDKMNQQEIEALKTQNANLQTQVNMATLRESQTAQTAALVADNTVQTQYLINRIAPYPIPSYTVPNPYGTTTASPAA